MTILLFVVGRAFVDVASGDLIFDDGSEILSSPAAAAAAAADTVDDDDDAPTATIRVGIGATPRKRADTDATMILCQ